LEHHPELFQKAEWYEEQGTSEGGYTWQEKPMSYFRENAERIKKKRVRQIVKSIRKMQQLELFTMPDEEGFFDMFAVTSCGLFCGK
jgi:hypothetical protein